MKKQKLKFRYYRYDGSVLYAKREISYEIKLSSRLIFDELCFEWNKQQLTYAINRSIDNNDKERFLYLSDLYRDYIR